MRSPSGRCLPHTVDLVYQVWGTDVDGGRQVISTTTRENVRCFIQFGRSDVVIEDSETMGLRRVTRTIPSSFSFAQHVALKPHDLIRYCGDSGQTKTFAVNGYSSASKLGSYWIAFGDESE